MSDYCFDSKNIKSINANGGKVSRSDDITFISRLKIGTDCVLHIETAEGARVDVVTLSREQAEHLWKAKIWGEERVFMTEANLLFDKQEMIIYGNDAAKLSFSVFPDPGQDLWGDSKAVPEYSVSVSTSVSLHEL